MFFIGYLHNAQKGFAFLACWEILRISCTPELLCNSQCHKICFRQIFMILLTPHKKLFIYLTQMGSKRAAMTSDTQEAKILKEIRISFKILASCVSLVIAAIFDP